MPSACDSRPLFLIPIRAVCKCHWCFCHSSDNCADVLCTIPLSNLLHSLSPLPVDQWCGMDGVSVSSAGTPANTVYVSVPQHGAILQAGSKAVSTFNCDH